MKTWIAGAAFASSLCLSGAAQAAESYTAYLDDRLMIGFDLESLTRSGSIVTVRQIAAYATDLGTPPHAFVLVRAEFDCDAKRHRRGDLTAYDRQGLPLPPVDETIDKHAGEWMTAKRGSIVATALKAACDPASRDPAWSALKPCRNWPRSTGATWSASPSSRVPQSQQTASR